jgi:hypothetical protein
LWLSEDVTANPQRQPNGSHFVCSWFTVDLDTNDFISVTYILYEMVHTNAKFAACYAAYRAKHGIVNTDMG